MIKAGTLEETNAVAEKWLDTISNVDSIADGTVGVAAKSFIAGLNGHLGAGKTAFVKCVAKALGITEEVTSPTFVIMKMYPTAEGGKWKRLVHIDAYRLERREELQALDFESVVSDPNNLVMIEWPMNAGLAKEDFSPGGWIEMEIRDGVRHIDIS